MNEEENIVKELEVEDNPNIEKLVLVREEWTYPDVGSYRKRWIAYCDKKPKCYSCGKTIEFNSLAFLLIPKYKFVCLKCCDYGNVSKVLIPRVRGWKNALPVLIKKRG